MASYTFSDVSSVDNFDLTSYNRCIESSWTSLLEAYPWEAAELGSATDDEKKEHLRTRATNLITAPDGFLCRVYGDNAHTCFYMGGNIDRDEGRITITYLIYGTDDEGSRRYIATDVFEMKKGFRVWARANNCTNIDIVYKDSATSMRSAIQNRYENHSADLGTSTELNERGQGGKKNHYRLPTSPDADLLDI
jgi:hypothetical protein